MLLTLAYLSDEDLEAIESYGGSAESAEDCFFCGDSFAGNLRTTASAVYLDREFQGSACPSCVGIGPVGQTLILRARAAELLRAYDDIGCIAHFLQDELSLDEPCWKDGIACLDQAVQGSLVDRSKNLRRYRFAEPTVTMLGYVYVLGCPEGYCKIGYSQQLTTRLLQLSIQLPFKIELLCSFRMPRPREVETWLHRYFRKERVNGEWFSLTAEQIQWLQSQNPASLNTQIQNGKQVWPA